MTMMLGPMLQALLEDRFQLKIHRETSEGPVCFLSVARGGPKLHPFNSTPRWNGWRKAAAVPLSAGVLLARIEGHHFI